MNNASSRYTPNGVYLAMTDGNNQPGRPAQPIHSLLAGAVGGCLVWGQWSAISHQVLLYISIRVLAALWKLLPIHRQEDWRLTHRLAATVAWAAVMYLWETHPDKLQSSMRKSMHEIYDSSWPWSKLYS